MTTSIKITALQNIGANIAYTTLVPVVNMGGTPTTQKANLQIVGNLILNGAGGSYFPRAAQANLALSVANAAQPNITSVGTLTSLAVTGNITSGNANLGNLVVANYFSGDGGFLSNVSGTGSEISNGTSNVTIVEDGAISMAVNGSDDVVQVGISGIAVTGGISATGNVNAGQNFRAPGELRVICNTGNGAGATWRFGTGGALYWPAPVGGQWAIEPNIDDEFELHSHTNVVISTDTSNANLHFTFDSDGIFTAQTVIRTITTTVSALPSAATVGAGSRAFVTDADSITFNAPAVGGGSNNMPVFSNGTGWFIG